jgi:uncharacterized protein YndB with AHSA1/START domain
MTPMARNDVLINAPASDVFNVLTDAGAYGSWVVGTKEVRGHDRAWPRRGSKFHHTIGAGPMQLRDNTEVLDIRQGQRLLLEVRVRPFGTAVVDIAVRPEGGNATKVTMHEMPLRGPLARTWNPVFDAVTFVRNVVALRRLKRLCETPNVRSV